MSHPNLLIVNADLLKYDWVCADVETTGLNPNSDEIVEIAVREFNMKRELGAAYVQRCRPMSGMISEGASKVHGIMYEDVKSMPVYGLDGVQLNVAKFISKRSVVGHNIIAFDLGFIKIAPVAVVDTLKMSRERFPRGKNNLKAACLRAGIEWDEDKAHSALYDVDKTIELLWAYEGIKAVEKVTQIQGTLFSAPEAVTSEVKKDVHLSIGVTPEQKHLDLLATQQYSYSRIKLFRDCQYKWYFQYILNIKQPDVNYFRIGKAAHDVVENSGAWCQRELFINKFEAWAQKTSHVIPTGIQELLPSGFSHRDVAELIYHDRTILKANYDIGGISNFHYKMDSSVQVDEYEHPRMPGMETYAKYIRMAATKRRVDDPGEIRDLEAMLWRFYKYKDFSQSLSIVSITEKKLAFDSNWDVVSDFFGLNVFFRGVIDLIEFIPDEIIITDYKSSRNMKSANDLRSDMQLKIYILLLLKFLPAGSFKRVTVKIDYIRFCESIEHTFDNLESVANDALEWIRSSINDIEKEMLKKDGKAFLPTRNENCATCHIGMDGKCPLFNKNLLQDVNTDGFFVSNEDECRAAWKRIEANDVESKRLAAQCKSFMKNFEGKLKIDENATLDFWVTQKREYDPFLAAIMLLKKGHKVEDFLRFMSFPESGFDKYVKMRDIKLTEQELDEISVKGVRHTFDAYTDSQAISKKCLNAPVVPEAKTED